MLAQRAVNLQSGKHRLRGRVVRGCPQGGVLSPFLSPKQFGFREGMSTEDALNDFYTFIHKAVDDKFLCASFFVDITKAFDMVNHELLLKKLYKIGFRGSVHRWFSSYLCNRSQRVKIDDTISNPITLSRGVPQGSVLGPVFFLIFVNSIFSQDLRGKVTAFADDLGISYKAVSSLELHCDILHDIGVLRKWFAKHKLVISNKTKLMFYSLTGKEPSEFKFIYHDPSCVKFPLHPSCDRTFDEQCPCSSGCFEIEKVRNFKYLGVIIDSKLNWGEQILSLKKYFRCVVRTFYQLENLCPSAVLKMFYFGLFESKLSYGICCWGGAYKTKLEPLLLLQKCVIRKVCKANPSSHSFNLFKSLNILPLKHLFYFKVLKMFFNKSLYDFNRASRHYNLRRTFDISIPSFRTTSYCNSFDIVSRRLFNALPPHLKILRYGKSFLRKIKSWLLTHNLSEIETLIELLI